MKNGKKAPKKIMAVMEDSPIPSITIQIGIHAIGGMGRMTSMMLESRILKRVNRPMISPRNVPRSEASKNPVVTL